MQYLLRYACIRQKQTLSQNCYKNKDGHYILIKESIHQEVIIKEFPDLLCKHCPITSCQIDGETVQTVTDFIFLGSKITPDCDFSHEIKRCLLLGRKTMTNLDSILKSRNITLPTKVHLVKAMVSLVVMYGCESWSIKKAEKWRIDAFEL